MLFEKVDLLAETEQEEKPAVVGTPPNTLAGAICDSADLLTR